MPEFIPKANTPDQLARYVLELQSQQPSTGQMVAEGVSKVAQSIMDRIKAKQKLEAEKQLITAKENAEKQAETSIIDPKTGQVLSTVKGKVAMTPFAAQQVSSVISPTGERITTGQPGEKLLQQPASSYLSLGDTQQLTALLDKLPPADRSAIIQGNIPKGLVDWFMSKGVDVKYDPTWIERIKDYFTGEKSGSYKATNVIPKGEAAGLVDKNSANYVEKQDQTTNDYNQW